MLHRFFFSYLQTINHPVFSFGWFTSKKIKNLFGDRNIQLFVKQQQYSPYSEFDLLNFLVSLQEKIYKLDEYGEKNWKLDKIKIDNLWKNISIKIIQFGFTESETESLLKKMYDYMQVEIKLRANKLPNIISISEYYELKICDVHLQREIIRLKSQKKFNEQYYRLWEIIDITSEILDDLDDLKEDSTDYNCNRLLISNQLRGTNIIKHDYFNYCESLKVEFENLIVSQDEPIKNILSQLFSLKIIDLHKKLNGLDLTNFKSKVIEQLKSENKEILFMSGQLSTLPASE